MPPTPGVNAPIGFGDRVTADVAGNVYIVSPNFSAVFKLDQTGVLTRIAGNGHASYLGDGGPATNAQLNIPIAAAVDAAGNLFIAEQGRVRRVSPNGIITSVAGTGTPKFAGDGGPATDAQIAPAALAVDGTGNLFLAEQAYPRVRKVSPSGIISTAVGTGTPGSSGDGGPAASAQLTSPLALALDATGDLFIEDSGRIRKVSPAGIISTVVGGSPKSAFRGLWQRTVRATCSSRILPSISRKSRRMARSVLSQAMDHLETPETAGRRRLRNYTSFRA